MKATVLHGDCASLLDRQDTPLLGMLISPFSIHLSIKIKATMSGMITCLKWNIGSGWAMCAQRFTTELLQAVQSILCNAKRKPRLCYGVYASLGGLFKT